MDTKRQHKSKFAVLLVREKKDGTIRQDRIKNIIIILSALSFLIVAIALIFMLTLSNNSKKSLVILEYEAKVDELSDELEDLQKENDDLSNKLSILSETVATKVAIEEVKEEEIMDMSLPKGFPLGSFGPSTIHIDEEDPLTQVYMASEGNTIMTVGAGIVESIELDENYGNRLTIDHLNGYKSIYLNKGQPLVRVGADLGKGYILFLIGSDNKTLGFQITEEDKQIDPMDVMEIAG